MKSLPGLILVALLAIGSACAKPDWIQDTLVTVDVTGTWERKGGGPPFYFVIEQHGPAVNGFFKTSGYNQVGVWRPVEGTVSADAFSFRTKDGQWRGELTVNGDEMSGPMDFMIPGSGARRVRDQMILRRTSSSFSAPATHD